MADKPSAERACKEPNPIIDGRKANVNLAILGAKPRGNVAALSAVNNAVAAANAAAAIAAASGGKLPKSPKFYFKFQSFKNNLCGSEIVLFL